MTMTKRTFDHITARLAFCRAELRIIGTMTGSEFRSVGTFQMLNGSLLDLKELKATEFPEGLTFIVDKIEAQIKQCEGALNRWKNLHEKENQNERSA